MNTPRVTSTLKPDLAQILAPTFVLAVCLTYVIVAGLLVPYPGFSMGPEWVVDTLPPCQAAPSWCQEDSQQLQAGDKVLVIGTLSYETYARKRSTPPFGGYRTGDVAQLKVLRNERTLSIRWRLLGPTAGQVFNRLIGMAIFLPFWLAGTGLQLLAHPRDERWRLLITFNYLAAIGVSTGVISYLSVAFASQVLRASSWVMVAVCLHLHLVVPSPIAPRLRRYGAPVLYALAGGLALLEFLRLLPDQAYVLALRVAVWGSLALILLRLLSSPSPSDRQALRVMLAGIVLSLGPVILAEDVPALAGILAYRTTAPIVATLAVPLLPAFYIYAIYKRRLGNLELSANRVLGAYSFVVLYATAFVLVFALSSTWLGLSGQSLLFSGTLSIAFFAAALALWTRYRKGADWLLYGARYAPSEIIRSFTNRIPGALNREALVKLLEQEVTASLRIRESALYLCSQGETELLYAQGVDCEPRLSQELLNLLLAEARRYHGPVRGFPAPLEWVLLSIPLSLGQETVGLWLFGRRDPDDFYPRGDIELLDTLANEVVTAVQSVRLLEESHRKANEFAALYETARDLASEKDLQTLLRSVVERAMALTSAGSGAIYRYDASRGDLELAAAVGASLPLASRLKLGEGVAGTVAQTRQPAIVDDYTVSPHAVPSLMGLSIRAMALVPMVDSGELIGTLGVADIAPSRRTFTAEDVRLLGLFAGRAATIVRNARLYEEARARADQLTLVYEAGLALNSVLEPKAQLQLLFQGAMKALRAERVEYFNFDPATEEVRADFAIGFDASLLPHWLELRGRVGDETNVAGMIATRRKPLRLGDVLNEPKWVTVDPAIRSGMWVPIEREGQLRGILGALSTQPEAFSEQDERLLSLFANQSAVALENARLFAETELRLRRLSASRSVDATISASLDLRVTLNVLLDQVTSQLGVHAADVLLLNPHTQTLEFSAGRGFRSMALQHTRLRVGSGFAGKAALERRRVSIPNLAESTGEITRAPLLGSEGFVTYFGVPLIAKGQVKGVLEIFHRTPLHPDTEWFEFLETLAGQAAIAIDNGSLFESLQRSNLELTLAYDTTLEGWSRALDLRDRETEGHTERVTDTTLRLGRAHGVGEQELVHVRRGALLHDIGKMGIPDGILLKPGPLTEREWAIMRRHPSIAYELLSPIEFLRPAVDIPYCHHEKWDGSGYPRGLSAEQIPLAARVFAIADVWDALRSDRPYRDAWAEEKVRAYIWDQAGKHFDPNVVEVFLETVSA